MKKITAKFIGSHGSLGYSKGRRYVLMIKNSQASSFLSRQNYICIFRADDGGGACLYTNIETFLENWTSIKRA